MRRAWRRAPGEDAIAPPRSRVVRRVVGLDGRDERAAIRTNSRHAEDGRMLDAGDLLDGLSRGTARIHVLRRASTQDADCPGADSRHDDQAFGERRAVDRDVVEALR